MRDNNFFATKTLARGTKTWRQETLVGREPGHPRTEPGRPPTNRMYTIASRNYERKNLHKAQER